MDQTTADVISESARVRLRRLTPADAVRIFAIFSNPDVARYGSSVAMTDIAQAEKKIASTLEGYQLGTFLQLGIELKDGSELIGTCTLFNFHTESRRAEIGYVLAHEHWGRGLMAEALGLMIRHAFDGLNLNRLEADIHPENLASARSLERQGFERDGYLRERWIVAGDVSDSALYGLLARDWRARQPIESTARDGTPGGQP